MSATPEESSARVAGPRAERAHAWAEHETSKVAVLQVVTVLVLLIAWQVCSNRLISAFWISSPLEVASRLLHWLRNGYLIDQLEPTLFEALVGFAIGTIVGTACGVMGGSVATVGKVVEPVVLALYSLPIIAVAPLYILWFGIGEESKVFLAATTVLFIVFFNTLNGMRSVDRELVDVVRIMGAHWYQVMFKVTLPGALPALFVGLKVALPFAVIGAVVGELIASSRGIGYVIQYAVSQFDTTGVFVGLFVIAAVSVALGGLLRIVEARVLRWQRL